MIMRLHKKLVDIFYSTYTNYKLAQACNILREKKLRKLRILMGIPENSKLTVWGRGITVGLIEETTIKVFMLKDNYYILEDSSPL